ncbi:MAG: hypothetical protein K2I49_02385 [Ureaplasma sp.]|nr:hypothetical protein [Ureaplasma sp.]
MFVIISLGLIIFFSIGIYKFRRYTRDDYDKDKTSSEYKKSYPKNKKKFSRYDLNDFVDDY